MEITEKVAYLKGLAEGMELDTEKKEGKLLAAIIDVLDDIALEIADMKADQEELYDGLDAVSDDLEDVEDAVFGEDDEDEEDVYEYEEPEEDEDCYATTCPTCEETIYFDESVLEDGEVICPNCGEKLEFDLNGLEDEDKPQEERHPVHAAVLAQKVGAAAVDDKVQDARADRSKEIGHRQRRQRVELCRQGLCADVVDRVRNDHENERPDVRHGRFPPTEKSTDAKTAARLPPGCR